jgi:hypothetical protein
VYQDELLVMAVLYAPSGKVVAVVQWDSDGNTLPPHGVLDFAIDIPYQGPYGGYRVFVDPADIT